MLKGKVCLVTGASRGVGRGVARELGAAGATVYVTGRTAGDPAAPAAGTVLATAREVTEAGGKGIAVVCDHARDADNEALCQRIGRDVGHLDILVNSATALPEELTHPGPFWRKSLDMTSMFDVGMRSAYVVSYYAAPLLLAAGGGLVVNISSGGARCYMHGPAYGAAKAALDKMTHDMAYDLRDENVAAVSLWLGLVKTERAMAACAAEPEKYGGLFEHAESPDFAGRVIAALYQDPARPRRSGKVYYAAELAREYGIADIDGKQPPSHRDFLGAPTEFSPTVVQ